MCYVISLLVYSYDYISPINYINNYNPIFMCVGLNLLISSTVLVSSYTLAKTGLLLSLYSLICNILYMCIIILFFVIYPSMMIYLYYVLYYPMIHINQAMKVSLYLGKGITLLSIYVWVNVYTMSLLMYYIYYLIIYLMSVLLIVLISVLSYTMRDVYYDTREVVEFNKYLYYRT